jgi:mannose-6-phosphate isomerase-like protein (cupin superfamily)
LRARLGEDSWLEFLRVPAMSAGLYRLPKGSRDEQGPHREDEVYVVLDGRATLEVEGERVSVGPHSIVFVPAMAGHRFIDIEEDLLSLVVFAPAETEG